MYTVQPDRSRMACAKSATAKLGTAKLATSPVSNHVPRSSKSCASQSSRREQLRHVEARRGRWAVGVRAIVDTSLRAVGTQDTEHPHHRVQGVVRDGEVGKVSDVDVIRQLKLITALKTPYNEDGSIDMDTWIKLVGYQIDGGANALVVAGTTGEGHLMDWDEHIKLIGTTVAFVKKEAAERYGDKARNFKVIGYTGSNCTSEALNATEEGLRRGMDAALLINPYYGKTSQKGLREHFACVCHLGPWIVYNVPSRTNQDIPPSFMEELSRTFHNFVGVKECVGNDRVAHYTKLGLTVWSGNDDEFHQAKWKHGARGVISVVSNLVPGLVSKLLEAENDEANAELLPLVKWLFEDFNPIGVSTALAQLGVIKPVFRLPYCPRDIEHRQKFVQIVESIGKQHFVGTAEVRPLKDEDFKLVHDHKRNSSVQSLQPKVAEVDSPTLTAVL